MYYRIRKIIDNMPSSFYVMIFVIPSYVLMIMPIVLILCYAHKLGQWWVVLLVLYIVTLISVTGIVLYFKEVHALRGILGDELFFKKFPHEKKRYIRKLRREEKRKLRKQNIKT